MRLNTGGLSGLGLKRERGQFKEAGSYHLLHAEGLDLRSGGGEGTGGGCGGEAEEVHGPGVEPSSWHANNAHALLL